MLGLRFPNSKNIFCPPYEQVDLSTVLKSWVGLDIILYALKILGVLQVLRALPPFHQENVIVKLFVYTGGLCQNRMRDGQKTSKR